MIEQVQVEALDVTVLKGSGQAVIDWCTHNGFLVSPEIEAHLLRYASSSPVFMAAKYNTSLALQRHQQAGDGVPLLITMHTPHLWVPLEILANAGAPVNADLFLLTDQPVHIANGVAVTSIRRRRHAGHRPGSRLPARADDHEPPPRSLVDRNMSWVPAHGYVTYLTLNAPGATVTYDLGVGSDSVIRLASFGSTLANLCELSIQINRS